jgi:hypothetical protein
MRERIKEDEQTKKALGANDGGMKALCAPKELSCLANRSETVIGLVLVRRISLRTV